MARTGSRSSPLLATRSALKQLPTGLQPLDQFPARDSLELPWQEHFLETISLAVGAVAGVAVGTAIRMAGGTAVRASRYWRHSPYSDTGDVRFEFSDPRRERKKFGSGYQVGGITHHCLLC
jgi:hypothetical protein